MGTAGGADFEIANKNGCQHDFFFRTKMLLNIREYLESYTNAWVTVWQKRANERQVNSKIEKYEHETFASIRTVRSKIILSIL